MEGGECLEKKEIPEHPDIRDHWDHEEPRETADVQVSWERWGHLVHQVSQDLQFMALLCKDGSRERQSLRDHHIRETKLKLQRLKMYLKRFRILPKN